ncbi:MAG: hypothetical protein LBL98_05535 [Ruminococcus sp.]|jgi:hypothetical protein|nr:hypothetical protein [Ruminococcus sp.]
MTDDNVSTVDIAEKRLPTLDELLEDWYGAPPEKYDWGKPFGKEFI